MEQVFITIYTFALCGLAVFGLHSLLMSVLFLAHWKDKYDQPPTLQEWPSVCVQLPVYNERFVIERLIDHACALDYPVDLLFIQVLDDSTDCTSEMVCQRVAYYQSKGVNIEHIQRSHRLDFKAGALAYGMQTDRGEFIAIFDADFAPPRDFLSRLIPYLVAEPRLGMIQGRWGHLNAPYSPITRAQALFLDGHFVIEQIARSRSGLFFNFNGSAGIWRRACIEDAGGWRGDTLAEDLDLSYRAQMCGWKMAYTPDVIAPAEIPPLITAFRNQQYRWACGAVQVLLKMGGKLFTSHFPLSTRLIGYLHLGAYLAHPLMLLLMAATLPVVLLRSSHLPPFWLSFIGLAPPFLFALSQWAVYPNWKYRFSFFPVLFCLGIGLSLSNTVAVIAALSRRPTPFRRTPKFQLNHQGGNWRKTPYQMGMGWMVWGELGLALYSLVLFWLAIKQLPALASLSLLWVIGFGYTGIAELWQAIRSKSP